MRLGVAAACGRNVAVFGGDVSGSVVGVFGGSCIDNLVGVHKSVATLI